ncbi:MAG: AtpZ/AtpI family protein [Pseudomonadota bacterium]|nr:AtpZ/AtpI family protein [Pseudomonadota bacterium]
MAENGPGQDSPSPEDARLTSLHERLSRAQAEEAVRTGKTRKPADSQYELGNRVLSYLLGGLLGGGLIGWVLDAWFGTSPWLLLTMLFLGTAAGFRSIIRISRTPPS